jgi:molecular chaperone GrpE
VSDRPPVRISDKRVRAEARGDSLSDVAAPDVAEPGARPPAPVEGEPQEHNYLDDLKRLQAEFDNYRKRVMREQTQLAGRASERLIEKLLPVLDHFDRALEHGEVDEGIRLVHKELLNVLSTEGLEEIPALNQTFDPTVHDAVSSHEEADVSEPTVAEVFRSGFSLGGRVLRPAMVSVARPPEPADNESDEENGP